MTEIHVCSLAQLARTAAQHQPSHLITLMSDVSGVERPGHIPPAQHLALQFNDIPEPLPGMVAPAETHVRDLLRFGGQWQQDTAPLLIHCWAGISRSTAAAYMLVCALNPDRDEEEVASTLRAAAPSATPNPRLVRLADDVLGREGRMVQAISRIGRGETAGEGAPFSMPLSSSSSSGGI
jgi:predicted protein tyrosine phosphatase